MFFGDVRNVSKHNTERNGKYTANTDHGKEPPRVDGHQGYGYTGEQYRDQQEYLPAANIGQRADQRC